MATYLNYEGVKHGAISKKQYKTGDGRMRDVVEICVTGDNGPLFISLYLSEKFTEQHWMEMMTEYLFSRGYEVTKFGEGSSAVRDTKCIDVSGVHGYREEAR